MLDTMVIGCLIVCSEYATRLGKLQQSIGKECLCLLSGAGPEGNSSGRTV